MKKILKIVFGFLGVVYLAVAIFAIVCLLSKNRFGYPQFGEKTLFVVEDDNTALNYRKGDLVVLRKPKNEDMPLLTELIEANDSIQSIASSIALEETVASLIAELRL